MRILHLADLHLGRALGELSREAEQRALVNELITLADQLDIAATLIAGDVFDAFSPPACSPSSPRRAWRARPTARSPISAPTAPATASAWRTSSPPGPRCSIRALSAFS